jgi:hypothetical protein
MARGWGRSEEDQAAEKEDARDERAAASGRRGDAVTEAKRRSLRLTLTRVEDLLGKTQNPARRQALEAARAEIQERLAGL